MSHVASSLSGWDALGWILAHNSRDVYEQRFSLLSEVVAWFKSLAMFGEMERDRMILQDPTDADRAAHKSSLVSLIAEGEKLRSRMEREGRWEKTPGQFGCDDFIAALDSLYDDLQIWHGAMSPERKAEILSKVFDGSLA
jgi:hypothetical protein